MKPEIERSSTQIVLESSVVQLVLLIIFSIIIAEIVLSILSYFRPYLPLTLDNLLFDPVLLIFFLSPFTGSTTELKLIFFDPSLPTILILPLVYFVLFRPWINRLEKKKKVEEMRLENERIEYARKVKNEFITNLGHEVRTYLNSIIGFSDLLRQKTAGELNEKQAHFVGNVFTSGNRLLAIISDLLDLSKIETGKLELEIEKISVSEVMDETIAPLKENAEKQKVMLKKELDPALEFMEADRHIFKQIMYNLLSNAIKFSKESGGEVTITAKKDGEMARVSVKDTGIGIREEDMKKLFTQFPHIDSGVARNLDGPGLGLAIAKQLVELHGGKIWAESEFGEGSTFTFLLPLKAMQKESK